MKIDVIGISGKSGSGKNFLSLNVFEPRGYAPWALAWPLKVQVCGMGHSFEDVFTVKPPVVREALQRIGTEEGRALREDIWVDQTRTWLRVLHDNFGLTKFVITDIRFPNECRMIRELGGKLVRITHGFGLPYKLGNTPAALHASETALDKWHDWDLQIINGLATSAAAWRDENQAFMVGEGQTLSPGAAMRIYCEKSGVLS